MDKQYYDMIIKELKDLNRPDYEIEEIGYFWNELVILKKEKMPQENINQEIDKFQRIVIENNLSDEDKEELYEELSHKQYSKRDLISYLKQESFYSEEDLKLTEANIEDILEQTGKLTLSEFDLYKYNDEEFNKALEQEKADTNYKSFDYAKYLKQKLDGYEEN